MAERQIHEDRATPMRSFAWLGWKPKPWGEIRSFYSGLDWMPPHMLQIVDSVEESGRMDQLFGTTSMHDLVVSDVPGIVRSPDRVEVVVVRAPGSLHPPAAGCVLVEHQSHSGHDDSIERPTAEAVPLFWRFVIEKFGIRPDRDSVSHD